MFNYDFWGVGTFGSHLNMALEEFMLKYSARTKRAAVRFYSFPQDAIILGYAQAPDIVKKQDGSFTVARRATGGSHVQVGPNVLAYSFSVPRNTENGDFRGFEEMRAHYHDCVAKGLGDLGIDSIKVDNDASTIMVGGKIVASGAIHWGRDSGLLHGLILMDPYNMDTLDGRVHLARRRIGSEVYTEYGAIKNIPAVSKLLEITGTDLPAVNRVQIMREMVSHAILRRVTEEFTSRRIDQAVMHEAVQMAQQRYGSNFWIQQREPDFASSEVEAIPGEELHGKLRKGLGYCLFSQVPDHDFKKMTEPTPSE